MTFGTRKIEKGNVGGHKQILFNSFKIYSVGESEKALSKITFPSYERYHNINKAYSNFFQEMIEVGNNIAPLKTRRIKKKQGMV